MSTTETAIIPAYRNSPVTPVPARRSILRPASPRPGGASFADWRGQARTEELPAVPHVSTPTNPTNPTGSRVARHLRAAVTGIALAAALLTGLQLYAAQGIADARRVALEQASSPVTSTEQPAQPAQSGWAIEGTSVDAPSPLDLPRCTTSPDTPLPCLATISPSQDRAVVLEEDTSLTALVRR